MFVLLWNVSAAIRGYLRYYMPTDRALDWLRTPHGLKWAIPAAFAAVPTYVYAASASAIVAARPGLGWANVLVILFLWNAAKFGVMGLLAPLLSLRSLLAGRGDRSRRGHLATAG